MSQTVEYILHLQDRMSGGLAKITGSSEQAKNVLQTLKEKTDALNSHTKEFGNTLSELRSKLDLLKSEKELIPLENLTLLKKYNKEIKELEKTIDGLDKRKGGNGIGGLDKRKGGNGIGGLTADFVKAQLIIDGIKAGAQAVYDFGKESIMAYAKVEKFGTALQVMLGTKGAADARMAEYSDIAGSTPFTLTQVVEAGNQLQALGKYSRTNLTMLGDLASAAGKPMEQTLSAYAKLASGQKGIGVDMFRDLLISAKDWQEATGKGISKNGELLASTEELIAALPKILQKKGFAGMMEAQSKTTEGMISNMEDAGFRLQSALGERLTPAFKSFLSVSTAALDKTREWIELPAAERLDNERQQVNRLVMELESAFTPLDRRNAIYAELKKIDPEVVAGINAEKIELVKLNSQLMEYNGNMLKKIMLSKQQAEYDKLYSKWKEATDAKADYALNQRDEIQKLLTGGVTSGFASINTDSIAKANLQKALNNTGLTNNPVVLGQFVYEELDRMFKRTMPDKNSNNSTAYRDAVAYAQSFVGEKYKGFDTDIQSTQAKLDAMNSQIDAFKKAAKITEPASGNAPAAAGGNASATLSNQNPSATLSNLSSGGGGGGAGKNVTININNLIEGNVVFHTQTMSESKEQLKSYVYEALLGAVNDVQMN